MKILKLLLNITTIADQTTYSTFYQFLKFAITNISTQYMICGLIIVICMFATTLRNLIYKVLNLAVLSVFVVALWAYLTDVTFIYVVYILTFVSAVVMLFLSVVLMLPSSAIAVAKRNASVVLLTAIVGASETSIITIITKMLVDIAISCLLLIVIYLVWNCFKLWVGYYSWTDAYFEDSNDQEFDKTVKKILTEGRCVKRSNLLDTVTFAWWPLYCMRVFTFNILMKLRYYVLNRSWTYSKSFKRTMYVQNVLFYRAWVEIRGTKKNPYYFFPGTAFGDWLATHLPYEIATGVAEDAADWQGRIDIFFLKLNWFTFNILMKLRYYVLNRSWTYSKSFKRTMDLHNAQFYRSWMRMKRAVYGRPSGPFYVLTSTPFCEWLATHLPIVIAHEITLELARLEVRVRGRMAARKAKRKRFFYRCLIPFHAMVLPSFAVRAWLKLGDKLSFLYVPANAYHSFRSFLLNTDWLTVISKNSELLVQAIIILSVFFIAIPTTVIVTVSTLEYVYHHPADVVSSLGENLTAIQSWLYTRDPLFLLVSVTSLLIALIGVSFFISKNK